MEHFHSNLRQKLQHWWNSSIMLQFRNGRLLQGIGACFCFNMTSVFIGRVWNTSVLALGQVVSYEELNLEWNFSYVKCKIKSFPLPVASNYEKDCLVENLTLRIFVEMFDITWSNYGRTKTGLRETQSYRIEWQLINGINLDYWVQFMLDYFIKHID